jgi:hypothetical protein
MLISSYNEVGVNLHVKHFTHQFERLHWQVVRSMVKQDGSLVGGRAQLGGGGSMRRTTTRSEPPSIKLVRSRLCKVPTEDGNVEPNYSIYRKAFRTGILLFVR